MKTSLPYGRAARSIPLAVPLVAGLALLTPWPGGAAAWSAVQPSAIDQALTGPPESLPTLWGRPPMMGSSPPPGLEPAPFAAEPDASTTTAPPPSPAPDTAVAASAPDQVGALVVQAVRRVAPTVERCSTGPAWWRAAKGSAVVWILGTPDQLPTDVAWDSACLRLRLAGARLLITPPLVTGAREPTRTTMRAAKIPLNQRLPAGLWARLSPRMSDNAIRARDEMVSLGLSPPRPDARLRSGYPPVAIRRPNRFDLPGGLVASTPLLFAPTLMVARRLATGLGLPAHLGNPVTQLALDLAGRAGMLVNRLPRSGAEIPAVASAYNPSEADQQACLDKVLTELDAGRSGRGFQPQIEAWARGDYQNGLMRMNVLNTCPYGQIGTSFSASLVSQGLAALEKAAAAGGTTVAILELDTLLPRGGLLERMGRAGWTITPPEQLR